MADHVGLLESNVLVRVAVRPPDPDQVLRMVVADARHFPRIAKGFAAVMEAETERRMRYLAHLTAMGVLDGHNPPLAAHPFMGRLNDFSL